MPQKNQSKGGAAEEFISEKRNVKQKKGESTEIDTESAKVCERLNFLGPILTTFTVSNILFWQQLDHWQKLALVQINMSRLVDHNP